MRKNNDIVDRGFGMWKDNAIVHTGFRHLKEQLYTWASTCGRTMPSYTRAFGI